MHAAGRAERTEVEPPSVSDHCTDEPAQCHARPRPEPSWAHAPRGTILAMPLSIVTIDVDRLPRGPWIYGRQVVAHRDATGAAADGPPPEDGGLVEVRDTEDRFIGHGLYNGASDIRIRMLARGRRTDLDKPREFLLRRLASCIRLRRKGLRLDEVTDAYRIVHGEGDDLPGLVVDRLGDTLVCEHHSLGFWNWREVVEDCLKELLPGSTVVHRIPNSARNTEHFPDDAQSDPPAPERWIHEHGLRFPVAPGGSHKTGWFCDQRDNRRQVAEYARGRDVLDLCCHAGGFALAAARAGAHSVHAVDLDEEPLARGVRAAQEQNLAVRFEHADAFNVLRNVAAGTRRPGLVILDPHKLIAGKARLDEGLVKYRDLNTLGLQAVAPGGFLATFSCSGALDLPAFTGMVFHSARRAEREIRLLATLGAGPDHPQRPDFGRSRYLKGLILAVD
jgi:23S rRNA (cytosine1962-C5)-methyltransferase